jgi:ApaG protein
MQGQISIEGGLSRLPVYEQTTRAIRVRVLPAFLADQSSPEDGGSETVQLIARYWQITDEVGRRQEVRGPGVVGAQPVLEPGQSFEYTSGCPLPTASGAMNGRYLMRSATGEAFDVDIPIFLLESPHERRQIH